MSNLGRRVLTAGVLVPLFLAALFLLSGWAFAVFLGAILLLAAWEWATLCRLSGFGRNLWLLASVGVAAALFALQWLEWAAWVGAAFWLVAVVAVLLYPRGQQFWSQPAPRLIAGAFVLIPAWAALMVIDTLPHGPWLVLWTMLMVWGADIGGYFVGHAFGRRKLAPAVSPGKTVEGLFGGVAVAVVLSVTMAAAAGFALGLFAQVIGITLLVVAAAVFGDLFESLMKRVAGVKDSGGLLPGHGGVLDRIDAVLGAAPIAALLLSWFSAGWMG